MQGQGKVSKIQNLKTGGVDMQREISKVEYTELKYCRFQYP